ncbi:TPA: polymorphic toxin type 50 domain-containing protein [Staphylococcus aureus]
MILWGFAFCSVSNFTLKVSRKGKVHYSKTGAHIVPYIDK